tara:strand:- start:1273 stop:1695 length:423 start_codon:yes stop_codon:yes gene_type:complete
MDKLKETSYEELQAVEGLGPVIATSVHQFFRSPDTMKVLAKLESAGVNFQGPEKIELAQTLTGKSIVVTGTLESYNRDEAASAIKDRGGKSPGSVSKKTDALVVGVNPGGSKISKAEELDVPIINEEAFEQLLETGEIPN